MATKFLAFFLATMSLASATLAIDWEMTIEARVDRKAARAMFLRTVACIFFADSPRTLLRRCSSLSNAVLFKKTSVLPSWMPTCMSFGFKSPLSLLKSTTDAQIGVGSKMRTADVSRRVARDLTSGAIM